MKALIHQLVPRGSTAHRALKDLKRTVRRPFDRIGNSAMLAYAWRSLMMRTTVIAITGSVGKSTCRELLYEILSSEARTHKTINNENDRHGLPRVLLRMRPWHRFAVIEVASGGPGTMKNLARLVRPDIAIITAVARTHTNRYDSIEDIAREKSELLRHLKPSGIAILNGDDERVASMSNIPSHRVVFFGTKRGNDIVASRIQARWPERLSLRVTRTRSAGDREQHVRTRLVGEHWVYSVLAAIGGAEICGVPIDRASAAISRVEPFRGRMQPVQLPNGAVMIRDQNASIDVLKAMLRVARSARTRRRVIVLGDITDTGLRSKPRQQMAGTLVAPDVDVAVFVGGGSRHAATAAIAAGLPENSVFSMEDIEQTEALLRNLIEPGDLVFVKGQGTQHLSRLVFARFGRIGCWVHRCTIRKDCDICPHLDPSFDLAQALRWVAAR